MGNSFVVPDDVEQDVAQAFPEESFVNKLQLHPTIALLLRVLTDKEFKNAREIALLLKNNASLINPSELCGFIVAYTEAHWGEQHYCVEDIVASVAKRGDPEMVKHIMELCSHQNEQVVREAFACIAHVAEIGDKEVIEFLVDEINDTRQMINRQVLYALQKIAYRSGNQKAIRTLLMKNDLQWDSDAMLTLARIAVKGDKTVIDALVEANLKDPNPNTIVVHELLDDKTRMPVMEKYLPNLYTCNRAGKCCNGDRACVEKLISSAKQYGANFFTVLPSACEPYDEFVVNYLMNRIPTITDKDILCEAIRSLSKIVTRVQERRVRDNFTSCDQCFEDITIISVVHAVSSEKNLFKLLCGRMLHGKRHIRDQAVNFLLNHLYQCTTVLALLRMVDRDNQEYLDHVRRVITGELTDAKYSAEPVFPIQLELLGEVCTRGTRPDLVECLVDRLPNLKTYVQREACLKAIRHIASYNDTKTISQLSPLADVDFSGNILLTISTLIQSKNRKLVTRAMSIAAEVTQGGNLYSLITIVCKHSGINHMISDAIENKSINVKMLMANCILEVMKKSRRNDPEWQLSQAQTQELKMWNSLVTEFILLCNEQYYE
jgi:hypothetical protein